MCARLPLQQWLVIGLGNDILRDDRVGLAVVRQLLSSVPPNVVIREAAVGGMALLETLVGFDRALIVDAVQTRKWPVGSVRHMQLHDMPTPLFLRSAHDADLLSSLELGLKLGLKLPKRIDVVAVEVKDACTFGETMTEEVIKALPQAVKLAQHILACFESSD